MKRSHRKFLFCPATIAARFFGVPTEPDAYSAARPAFSLLEVLVVMALVAVLFSVSIPPLRSQLLAGRRIDARIALFRAIATQEQWFLQNGNYTDQGKLFGSLRNGSWSSPGGYYSLRLNDGSMPCRRIDGKALNCYVFSAEASDGQRRDRHCRLFYVNHLGQHGSRNSEGKEVDGCW